MSLQWESESLQSVGDPLASPQGDNYTLQYTTVNYSEFELGIEGEGRWGPEVISWPDLYRGSIS